MALLTGYPNDVAEPLLRFVLQKVEHLGIGWFGIGRSVHPPSRCYAKGCDGLFDLYSTRTVGHAMDVERWLLQQLRGHRKLRAGAFDARGNVARGRQFVYLLFGTARGWALRDGRLQRNHDWHDWIPAFST